jgi:hypothetical protein
MASENWRGKISLNENADGSPHDEHNDDERDYLPRGELSMCASDCSSAEIYVLIHLGANSLFNLPNVFDIFSVLPCSYK